MDHGLRKVKALSELVDFLLPLYKQDLRSAMQLATSVINGEATGEDLAAVGCFTEYQVWKIQYLAAGHRCPDCGGDCEAFYQMVEDIRPKGDA